MPHASDNELSGSERELIRKTRPVTSREDLLIQRERLRVALESIKARAYSDAPAEELEDVQRDLRHIFAIARDALLSN